MAAHMTLKNRLDRLVDVQSRTGGSNRAQFDDIYNRQALRKAKTILDCPDQSLHEGSELLSPGRSYRSPAMRTNPLKGYSYRYAERGIAHAQQEPPSLLFICTLRYLTSDMISGFLCCLLFLYCFYSVIVFTTS